jgi:uncharacterized protein YndB with AHSA1/START domain
VTARRASSAPTVVQVRRTLPATSEEVFRAWTEPALISEWFKPRGGSSPGAEVDLRVGGNYRWCMTLLGHSYYAIGEYIEIDPPKRLVFTFGWEHAIVRLTDSLVTVDFRDRGDHSEVVITHERLPNRAMRALHGIGWQGLLKDLGKLMGRQIPAHPAHPIS